MRETICAVVVSYNPEPQLVDNVKHLLPQVDEVVVVDNGSSAKSDLLLSELHSIARVQVIRSAENLGIAAALNTGARYALSAGYAWLATFDQDSTPAPDFIQRLLNAYAVCPYREDVALVSPRYRDKVCVPELIHSYSRAPEHEQYAAVQMTMASGNLVRTSAFERAGFFDEPMFIDYVDYEFCLRLRRYGLKIIEAQLAILDHRCGNRSTHRFFGKVVRTTNYPPIRRYYNARSRIVVYKRYWFVEPCWVMRDLFAFLGRDLLAIVLYERDVGAKFSAIARGIGHGAISKLGRTAWPGVPSKRP